MNYCPSAQPDMHRVGIVIKVTSQSANIKRTSFLKVRDDDLSSFQRWLLCAPADDLHYSCGTMHRGLCSSQSYSVNETTWSQATGTLSKKKKSELFPPRMTLSLEATCIEEGQIQVWLSSTTMRRKEGCALYWQEAGFTHLKD